MSWPSEPAGDFAGYWDKGGNALAKGRLRVLLDGTPLLGSRTGVGRYTSALAEELASMPEVDMRAVAFTLRGWRRLRRVLPHGSRARGMPVSAQLLRKCWRLRCGRPVC